MFTVWASKKQTGFTIVELLIVIVVVVILAAITIVAYTGIQDRARMTGLQSAASQAGKKIAAYAITNTETYPDTLSQAGLADTADVAYTYIVNNELIPRAFCVSATSNQDSRLSYAFTSTEGGTLEGRCVRNYAVDPNGAGNSGNLESIGNSQAPNITSIATDQSRFGASAFKRSITGTGQIYGGIRVDDPLIESTDSIRWSFWVYSTRAGLISPWIQTLRIAAGSNWGTGGDAAGNHPVEVNTWTKVTSRASPTEQVALNKAGGYNLQVVSGDSVWFDGFMVTLTNEEYEFADGSYPGWVWEGQSNNSTSFGPAIRAE